MTRAAQLKVDLSTTPFDDAPGYLAAELRRLDLIIARRIQIFRLDILTLENKVAATPSYVSDQEVDWLLIRPHDFNDHADSISNFDTAIEEQSELIEVGIAVCDQRNINLPLVHLARLFELSTLESNVILLCLAPELRRKYDRIYAYLQDDITRKRPSLDLALELFIDDEAERWQARAMLGDGGGLASYGLVQAIEDIHSPSGSSGLSRLLKLDERILQFILGNNQFDKRIANVVRQLTDIEKTLSVDQLQLSALSHVVHNSLNETGSCESLLMHLHGMEGIGQRDLAMAICQLQERKLLLVDGHALNVSDGSADKQLLLLLRESVLLQAPLLIENIDAWLRENTNMIGRLSSLPTLLNKLSPLIFTSSQKPWSITGGSTLTIINVPVSLPNADQNELLWKQALAGLCFDAADSEILRLTQQFQLSPQKINLVSKQLHMQAVNGILSPPALAAACRNASHHNLTELSIKVKAHYRWDDLILPADIKLQLKNICAQVRFRRQVFDDWGFADKLPYGRGLSAMFSGTPGTGKTMAAQVLAQDLQLDLFKIDLSGVVSKYIGETEKNLSRVFSEAQASNAILFFDEADALFGKRTDVSDAHDRYANIEVSYLLQKMEDYDGVVILATNLRNNIDEAFIRRIRFIFEFPFPNSDNRKEIWKSSIPTATPIADEIDFQWLADRVKVAGGNIKNIVLNAAFNAAQQQDSLGMCHLLEGCKQEFQKIGKLWDARGMQYSKKNNEVI